ncbi:bifunctional aminoglycoside phosphotransferase/ATP-binding protein [Roseomonas sp. USHLN139]|uniref:bifunctional aminoglycoside phosphotransferase/ATP-binding protein n=1 Tax=Roseomonas sp. USHLN139 TaxID=3081298 RepID=UPI003B017015
MSIPAEQADAAALLRRLTGGEAPVETHISALFLGPDRVLKLKKAVDLGFLDFTSLAARARFIQREMALNAPHAPGLYRAVQPLTRGPDGALRLGGEGPAVEWALEMARVPAGDFLDAVARRGALDAALQDALGDAVAALHDKLPPVEGWDAPAALARVIAGNRAAGLAAGLPGPRIIAWAEAATAALARLSPWLARRGTEGRIRRCHGDLHLGNLLLWQGRPVPFDALEFDEALATIDTGYDLAFLLADLDRQVGRAAANRVLNRYVGRSGDAALVAGLPLWLSLRALIRAHCLARTGEDGLPCLAQAEAALRPVPPRLLAVGGLPGSGKSFWSRRWAPAIGAAPGALILRSDEIRKRRHGLAPEQRLPPEAYAPAVSAAVHDELFEATRAALAAGHSVIADAAFLDPAMRQGLEQLGRAAGIPLQGLWLEAPLAVLRSRVAARRGDASDAGLAVLEAAAARDPGPIAWQRLDTAGPMPTSI